jgi:hypothetical protein
VNLALRGELGKVVAEGSGRGDHVHTLAKECPGGGQADTLARAGDDGHLGCQSKVHGLYLLSLLKLWRRSPV